MTMRPAGQAGRRIAGLDGVRGLAALYVVINHIFLRAFPGYPADTAPFWASWFIYGRFACKLFARQEPARSNWSNLLHYLESRDASPRLMWQVSNLPVVCCICLTLRCCSTIGHASNQPLYVSQ